PASPVPLLPQISPPPGVDPFALLKSCIGATRKLDGNDVVGRFKQLRARFDRCDIKRLVQQTSHFFLMGNSKIKESYFFSYEYSAKSQNSGYCIHPFSDARRGRICAEVFDFWWNAVEAATPSDLVPVDIPQISPIP
ncbi:hypothetical protein PENTCL1PPCAC_8048, partial [Pristionchus entomophagus]